MPTKKLLIIDAMAMTFRFDHAFSKNPLRTKKGFPTSSLFGWVKLLLKIMIEDRPDYLIIASDHPSKTFRHEMFPSYKSSRKEMPEDIQLQLPKLFELFSHLAIPVLICPGFEADDIIGTIIDHFASEKLKCWIVSGDKDFMQLIGPHVSMMSHDGKIKGVEEVKEKFGCTPAQVTDVLALMGDGSDNIPGVPGIGEKGAKNLIQDYFSLENLLAHADQVSNKRYQNALLEYKEKALLCKHLVTIRTDVPINLELESYRFNPAKIDQKSCSSFLQELEFSALLNQLQSFFTHKGSDSHLEAKDHQQASYERSYHLVQTKEAFEALMDKLDATDRFAFDTETTGLDPLIDVPIGISFSFPDHLSFYLPLDGERKEQVPLEEKRRRLNFIFQKSNVIKIAHNMKFDLQMLKQFGLRFSTDKIFDTMIAGFLLDSTAPSFSLDFMSEKFLSIKKIPTTALIGEKKSTQISMKDVPIDALSEYACEDADCCLRLYDLLMLDLKKANLLDLMEKIEMPLVPILMGMELEGIKIDPISLKELELFLEEKIKELEKAIYDLAGESFNIQSPKQLQVILFEKLKVHQELGITKIKKTQSGYSTDVSVLEALSDHPICAKLLEFRTCSKLLNTYVKNLPDLIHPKTKRVHTHFHQTGTATGRLSSSNPNLQNIPIRTDFGKMIRQAFIAEEDHVLISADYSQVELRILAHLSKDPALIETFRSGMDVHKITAAKILGKSPEEVTSEERSRAKAINYGIVYGMGAQKLAKTIDSTYQEAKEFIDKYFEAFPKVRLFIDETIENAKKDHFVTTISGRRRFIEGIDGSLGMRVEIASKNIAINSPIQGTAADLVKIAMIRVDQMLKEKPYKARLLLQVHDELVLECPKEKASEVISLVKEAMEHAMDLNVALEVNIGQALNWLEAH